MRLWTIHPRYLDAPGLTALWREALLARKVLMNKTRGYRHHPQLARFRERRNPVAWINAYLAVVHAESVRRGYRFDRSKIGRVRASGKMLETSGQLRYEWNHLVKKLQRRSPHLSREFAAVRSPRPHPSFRIVPGGVSDWERGHGKIS
jgi:Pyrimidine dimer DNA glycosylase